MAIIDINLSWLRRANLPKLFFYKAPVISKKFTLGKQERLKSRTLIEKVFREGKNFSVFPFRVSFILSGPPAGGSPPLQTGFGASRRNFKKAVDRNRIKRLTREAWRLNKAALHEQLKTSGRTLSVFLIYTGKELPASQQAINEKILVILQKLMKAAG